MDTKTIPKALLARPFQPFTLRMNDGREYFVPHPEFAAISYRSVMAIDPKNAAVVHLEPLLIASLEYDPELPPA